jgi:hypothetical protein
MIFLTKKQNKMRKIIVSIIVMLFAMSAMAQTKICGNRFSMETQVINNFNGEETPYKITCWFISKYTQYVKIAFDDEVGLSGYNNGYVYLSNQNELNSFITDLESAMNKAINSEIIQINNPKYVIEITVRTTYAVRKKYKKRGYEICIIETIGGNGTARISLKVNEAQQLLDWLKTIKL